MKSSNSLQFEERGQNGKRLRLNDDGSSSNCWKVNALLSPEYTESVSSRNAIAFSLKEKNKISVIVKKLDTYFALQEKDRFIKRVRIKKGSEISILVHIFDKEEDGCTISAFKAANQIQIYELENDINGCEMFSAQVPSCAPKTRIQFEIAKSIWPCHFHEDKILESKINATKVDIWGSKYLDNHIRFMQITISSCRKSENAATVVDPMR